MKQRLATMPVTLSTSLLDWSYEVWGTRDGRRVLTAWGAGGNGAFAWSINPTATPTDIVAGAEMFRVLKSKARPL